MVDLDSFRRYTEWHHVANQRRYAAPAAPWGVVRVDPADVERFAVVELTWGLGRVRDGDWDRPENCRELDETDMFRGLRERFVEGLDWADTAYEQWVREEIDENGHFRGIEDLDTVRENHYPAVDDLYESMREDGYRPNFERAYDDPAEVEYIHELEPLVLVGRGGEVIWTEGFHRLAVAQIIGFDAIPVYVVRRHERWQRTRDTVAETRAEEPVDVDHPDLADLRS